MSGTSINIGRDLNLLNVGGNIELSNGAQFIIGRNLGLVSQPPKGTGTGSNVLTLNFTTVANSIITVIDSRRRLLHPGERLVDPRSVFRIGGNIFNTMYVAGSVTAGFVPVVPTPAPLRRQLRHRPPIGGHVVSTHDRGWHACATAATTVSAVAPTDTGYVTALGGFA